MPVVRLWSTTRNMEKDSGKGDQGQRVKVMGRGSDSSEGQNNLEGESVWPNSPLVETWKLMMNRKKAPFSGGAPLYSRLL